MPISYYVAWLGLVSFIVLPTAQGEIYTYERDGVIVISSEPPPKRLRPQRRKARRTKPRRAKPHHAKHQGKRSRSPEQSRRDKRARHTRSRWTPPRSLSRYRDVLVETAARYQLPARLLWSVISHCRKLRHPSQRQRRHDLSSCLSEQVEQRLALERTERRTEVKPPQEPTRSTSRLSKRERAARQLQGIASLLRRLINHFRGDVTLTLTAYPRASQSLGHYIFAKSDRALKLSNLLAPRINQGISEGGDPLPSDIAPSSQHKAQLRARRLAFTREALKLYHRLAREGE